MSQTDKLGLKTKKSGKIRIFLCKKDLLENLSS